MKRNISVHGLRTRTTSSPESYNAWIGKIFPKKANFFRFVEILNREINKNYTRFRSAVFGESFLHVPGRNAVKDRNNNIEACTQLLNQGIYDVETFSKQVTYLNVIPTTSLETSANLEDLEMTICDITVEVDSSKCAICFSKQRVIAYIPCSHLAQCSDCEVQKSCIICGATNSTAVIFSTTR